MPDVETRIADLVRRWVESKGRGHEIPPEELCTDCPELLDEVKSRIQSQPGTGEHQTTLIDPSTPKPSDTRAHVPVRLGPVLGGEEFSTIPDDFRGLHEGESFEVLLPFGDMRLHAKGGLGEVYAAIEESTNRRLALKTIRAELSDDEDLHTRMMVEAEITARLEHPGVVPVYGLGRSTAGRPFYVMRFVEGRTLEDAIRDHYRPDNRHAGRSSTSELHALLRDFVSVCKTIAYAHNRGIVHRDIKPHNILLGRFGETLVADWGLAMPVVREDWARESGEKTLTVGASLPTEEASGASTSGSGAGTPAYMSPEQASGTEHVGPASDVYNLGATLYKIVTGRAPFAGRNVETMMQRVTDGEFQPAKRVNPQIAPALDAICTKAMALDPRNRYRTAMEVAEDVERYLDDEKVHAYAEPVTARLSRWSRKHRSATQALVAATLLVTVCGIAAAVVFGKQAAREGVLHAQAEASRVREHTLRERSIQAAAEFAARGLANQIDVRWRVLERMAADPDLATVLLEINQDTSDAATREPLQRWLSDFGERLENRVPSRALFVNALDGTQVARYPQFDDDGQPVKSLGNAYPFRDYFHGLGQDLKRGQKAPPYEKTVNLSTVHESTNDGNLNVVFGTSIKNPDTGETIGILSMSVSIGEFADLAVDLPEGQSVLLVETRRYSMERRRPTPHTEYCGGLVLHRPGLEDIESRRKLPRIADGVLEVIETPTDAENNLLPSSYRDPYSREPNKRWTAAYAPVVVRTRDDETAKTGWVVIVQQAQPDAG